jgi:predicted transcriptional regulator
MDWIETTFGISPDGGNGTTEALFVAAAIAIASLLVARRRRFRDYARRLFPRRD